MYVLSITAVRQDVDVNVTAGEASWATEPEAADSLQEILWAAMAQAPSSSREETLS